MTRLNVSQSIQDIIAEPLKQQAQLAENHKLLNQDFEAVLGYLNYLNNNCCYWNGGRGRTPDIREFLRDILSVTQGIDPSRENNPVELPRIRVSESSFETFLSEANNNLDLAVESKGDHGRKIRLLKSLGIKAREMSGGEIRIDRQDAEALYARFAPAILGHSGYDHNADMRLKTTVFAQERRKINTPEYESANTRLAQTIEAGLKSSNVEWTGSVDPVLITAPVTQR